MEQIELRKAVFEDAEMVFRWRNLPEIVSLGSLQREVTWEEHRQWFRQTVNRPDRLLLIVQTEGEAIGQVRFDQHGQEADVSIYLVPGQTGRGLGVIALRHAVFEAFARMPIQRVLAFIRKTNTRSVSAFQKAGFQAAPEAGVEAPPDHFAYQAVRHSPVPHNRLTHGAAEAEAVRAVVESGRWACGPKVQELESALARMAGVRHAVCVASGLSALRLTLKGLGVGAGDRVLVPAYSCVALANAALALGAQPVPVDVAEADWNLDENAASRMIREAGPRAIIAVNLFGAPAAVERMRHAGIPIIEDCAHAFGMEADGRALGSRCQAGILSFYATKLIAAAEGGAVLTDSDELAGFIHGWRDYADQPPDGSRLNDKMTDIEAALALCQLERLPSLIQERERLAANYHEALARNARKDDLFRVPESPRPRLWYRYAVESRTAPAEQIIRAMNPYGISAARPVEDWRPDGASHCPVADRAYRQIVSLPLYPNLSEAEQERVIHAFLKAVRSAADV